MKLDNQVMIITGGASGMGKASVEYFSGLGLQVVCWDLQQNQQEGQEWASFVCDVSSEDSVNNALSQTMDQFGIPRILLNCAGIAPAKKLVGREEAMPLSFFNHVISVNLMGTFNVMRVVAQAMSQVELKNPDEDKGVIINTASIAAFEGQIGQVAYSASKGGVVAMTVPAARELAAHAIRVNVIAPGLIGTPMLLNMPDEVQDSLKGTVTWPKRFGSPLEFASLAQHIIENQYINGEVIRLDGALRMQAR